MTDAGSTTTEPHTPSPSGRGRASKLAYVPAFDGFRGVAAVVVLLGHSGWVTGSWLAVDMFFVMSGYLITSLLLVEAGGTGGRISLKQFWARRVRRLGPAMIITLIGVGAYAQWVAPERQRYSIRWDGIATLFEAMNWRAILTGDDYWASFGPISPLKHTWSLSIEEQLYVLWPLLVVGVLAWKKKPAAVACLAAATSVVTITVMLVLESRGASIGRLYQGTDVRATAMLFGSAVAGIRLHLGATRWRSTRPARVAAGTVAAVPLAVMWVVVDATERSTYRWPLPVAGILATLVIASIADSGRGGVLGRIFDLAPLVWLGRMSYGVYLYHMPIFLWLDQDRTGLDGLALFFFRSAISIGLAWVSYVFVEHPIRRGAVTGRRARAAVPGSMALALLALLLGTYGAKPTPTTDWNQALVRSSRPGAPTLVMAGDSVPQLLAEELVNQVDELGVNIGSVAVPGCHPLSILGPVRDPEGTIRNDTSCGLPGRFGDGTQAYRPDVSVLMFGRHQNDAVKLDGVWRMPCEPEYMAAFRTRVLAWIDDLQSTGGKVVLVSGPGSSVSWVLDAAPPGMFDRIACMNNQLQALAAELPNVGFVDLATYVCPAPEQCKEEIDGADLRPDTVHFEGPGAAVINRWLIPRVLDAAKDS